MTTDAENIAETFADILRGWLDGEQWDEMRRRNAAETSPDVCHSHDFCDANVAMDMAMQDHGYFLVTDGEVDEDVQRVWNAAWDEAKTRYLTA